LNPARVRLDQSPFSVLDRHLALSETTTMPLYYRVILGCIALISAGVIIRALQTGIVYGKGWTPYDRETQFGTYALVMFGHLVGLCICAWLAAGYTADDFFVPLGLGAFVRH
jgi:hypothetical protein